MLPTNTLSLKSFFSFFFFKKVCSSGKRGSLHFFPAYVMTHKQSGEKTPDCFKQEKEKTHIANTSKNSKTPIF